MFIILTYAKLHQLVFCFPKPIKRGLAGGIAIFCVWRTIFGVHALADCIQSLRYKGIVSGNSRNLYLRGMYVSWTSMARARDQWSSSRAELQLNIWNWSWAAGASADILPLSTWAALSEIDPESGHANIRHSRDLGQPLWNLLYWFFVFWKSFRFIYYTTVICQGFEPHNTYPLCCALFFIRFVRAWVCPCDYILAGCEMSVPSWRIH